MQPDLVIRGGLVHDGTGAEAVVADIAVAGDKIAEVGRIEATGLAEIDARGLVVAPGFIDIHSHSDFTLLVDPRARSAIHQGVTTEVVGNCGYGCFPIREAGLAANAIYGISDKVPIDWTSAAGYLERLEAARPAVNVATLVPNGQLRLATLGMSDRPATADERRAMGRALEEAMEAGAFGYSTGLEYAAEAAAPPEELEALCRHAVAWGGLYATHTRDRDAGAVDAVEEALATAERAGIRLQVSHLMPRSGRAVGERCIEVVEAARERGLDVAFDMHTRTFGTTYLATALPPWARAGTAAEIVARLRDPQARRRAATYRSILSAGGDWSRIVLLENARWPEYARRDIVSIASELGVEPFGAVCDLLAGVADDLQSLMVIIHAYTPEQQHEIFAHPLCVPASDATTLAPDGPLAASAFHGAYTWAAWFWRTMVVETGRLAPEDAIRKLTSQPADTLGLSGRGRIELGAFADIVVFDAAAFAPRGTTFEPNQLATGMRHVVVNGAFSLADGNPTQARNGRVLRHLGRR